MKTKFSCRNSICLWEIVTFNEIRAKYAKLTEKYRHSLTHSHLLTHTHNTHTYTHIYKPKIYTNQNVILFIITLQGIKMNENVWRRGNFRIFRFGHYWTDYRIYIGGKKNFLGSFKQEIFHITFNFIWLLFYKRFIRYGRIKKWKC